MAALCCFFMPRVFGFSRLSYPAVSLTVFGICVQLLSKTSVSSSGSAFSLELKGRVLTRNLGDASLQFFPRDTDSVSCQLRSLFSFLLPPLRI